MLLGGDEFRRTQGGNNNAYCQDNETSWIDWTQLEQHREIFRFAEGMIAFRRSHPVLSKEEFYQDAEIHWFGPQGGSPDWTDPREKHLGCLIHENEQRAICLIFNAGSDAVDYVLPALARGTQWRLAVDTFGKTPHDLFPVGQESLLEYPHLYRLRPRSSVILLAQNTTFSTERGSK